VETLQSKLIQKTFDGEDNIHCFALAAKFLMNLKKSQVYPKATIQQPDASVDFTLDQYWDKLLEHFTNKQSILVTESVLPLLGALLAQVMQEHDLLGIATTLIACVLDFAKSSEQRLGAELPEDMELVRGQV
jgi:hypothetical protein